MMKSIGMAAAFLLIAASASAQTQRAAPGSDAGNHAGNGYSQTQQPQATGPSAGGPARAVDNNAPGSAAHNNAAAGLAHSQAQPAIPSVAAQPDPARVIDNNAAGSTGGNNANTGFQSTR